MPSYFEQLTALALTMKHGKGQKVNPCIDASNNDETQRRSAFTAQMQYIIIDSEFYDLKHLKPILIANNIKGSVFHLIVNTANILTDDTEHYEHEPVDKQTKCNN